MNLLEVLLLSRVPMLNNHTLNWVAVLTFAWLAQRKVTKDIVSGRYRNPLRITMFCMATIFLVGVGELVFDPFIVVFVWGWNFWFYFTIYMVPQYFFYVSFLSGLIYFRFNVRRLWIFALPVGLTALWVATGFHTPASLTYNGADPRYYYDLYANFMDIATQVSSFFAGYYVIRGVRWVK